MRHFGLCSHGDPCRGGVMWHEAELRLIYSLALCCFLHKWPRLLSVYTVPRLHWRNTSWRCGFCAPVFDSFRISNGGDLNGANHVEVGAGKYWTTGTLSEITAKLKRALVHVRPNCYQAKQSQLMWCVVWQMLLHFWAGVHLGMVRGAL